MRCLLGGGKLSPVARRVAALSVAAVLALIVATPTSAATRVNYRAFDDTAPKTFFNKGGLKLIGQCFGGDALRIYASTSVDDAMIHANSQGGGSGDEYFEEDDFDTADGEIELVGGNFGLDATDDSSGQIVYGRPGGANVSIDWLAEEGGDGYSGARDCIFQGTARVVGAGSSGRANFRFDQGQPATTFFSQGGLSLIGTCTPGGLGVTARTNTENSMIHANSQYSGNNQNALVDNDLDPGADFFLPNAVNGTLDNASGQIVYGKPGGNNVTVDWAAEDGGQALGKDCVFNGTARVRKSGDSLRVNFRVPSGNAGPTTFFSKGGLKLIGQCTSEELTVTAASGKDFSTVHFNGQRFGTATEGGNNSFHTDTDDWREIFGDMGLDQDDSSGQIVHTAYNGTNVTVRWASEETNGFQDHDCDFIGTAEVGKP